MPIQRADVEERYGVGVGADLGSGRWALMPVVLVLMALV